MHIAGRNLLSLQHIGFSNSSMSAIFICEVDIYGG